MSKLRGARNPERRFSRRAFLGGLAVGAAGAWSAAVLPRRMFSHDPHRPPELYEYFVDNFWFDSIDLYGQAINAPLQGSQQADIVILGGGFAGMASAFHLARRFPERRIVLLEGACCGYGASGRNGGFADTGFLGFGALYEREGPEAARAVYDATLLGLEQIRMLVAEHGVECDLELNGSLTLATDESQMQGFEEAKRRYDNMGLDSRLLDQDELRGSIRSERFVGAFHDPARGILNPAKLARGMKTVIERAGVEVFERTRALRVEPGRRIRVVTEFGEVRAPSAVIALNGYAPQLGFFRTRILPLCNYVVATEPLTPAQLESIGWSGRESLGDARVQFMYLRLTADDRIVFGGESSPYFYDSRPSSGNYRPAIEKLERSILTTFPQLEGVRFTHAWGGTMGFTADFAPSFGVLGDEGNLYYAVGFSGEGVVMTQLAGRVIADLMAGEETDAVRLPFVNRRLSYVGHEPFRYPAVKLYERILEWGA
jgi:glycine/D-amino acid oxidase-like deaminating enzyme